MSNALRTGCRRPLTVALALLTIRRPLTVAFALLTIRGVRPSAGIPSPVPGVDV